MGLEGGMRDEGHDTAGRGEARGEERVRCGGRGLTAENLDLRSMGDPSRTWFVDCPDWSAKSRPHSGLRSND